MTRYEMLLDFSKEREVFFLKVAGGNNMYCIGTDCETCLNNKICEFKGGHVPPQVSDEEKKKFKLAYPEKFI
jgi:hypothetical protein